MTTVLPISTKFCSLKFGSGNVEFTNLRVQDKRGLCYGGVRGKMGGTEWGDKGKQVSKKNEWKGENGDA